MRILVGFEESGIVSGAFRALGHEAWSCDLLPTRGDALWHMQCDIEEALRGAFDLWILHPPCTATAVSGNGTYAGTAAREEACEFVADLYRREGPPRCIEQPITVVPTMTGIRPSQYINPWEFGHGETKKTALYLRGLPSLKPTNIVAGRTNRVWKMSPGPLRARMRSETYRGIAAAMADQWGRA